MTKHHKKTIFDAMRFKLSFSFSLFFCLILCLPVKARNIVIWSTEHAHIGSGGTGCYNAHIEMEKIFKDHIGQGQSNIIYAKESVIKNKQTELFVQIEDELLRNYTLLFVVAYDVNLKLNQFFELSRLNGYENHKEDIKEFLSHVHYLLKDAYPNSIGRIYSDVSSTSFKKSFVIKDFDLNTTLKDPKNFHFLDTLLHDISSKENINSPKEIYSEKLISLIKAIANVYFEQYIASNAKKYNLNNEQFWIQASSPFHESFDWLNPELLFSDKTYNYENQFNTSQPNEHFYAGEFIENHFREIFMQKKLSELMITNPNKNILLWVGVGHDWSLALSLLHQFILDMAVEDNIISETDIETIQILSENDHSEACNLDWVWQSTVGPDQQKNIALLEWAKIVGMRIPKAYYENVNVYSTEGELLKSFELSDKKQPLENITDYIKQLLIDNNFEAGTYHIHALSEESPEHKNQFELVL